MSGIPSLPGPSTDLHTYLWARCCIEACLPTVPSAPTEWWHPSTARAPSPASSHFLSAPGDSASSLLGRLPNSPVVCLCKNVSPGSLTSLSAEVCEALAQEKIFRCFAIVRKFALETAAFAASHTSRRTWLCRHVYRPLARACVQLLSTWCIVSVSLQSPHLVSHPCEFSPDQGETSGFRRLESHSTPSRLFNLPSVFWVTFFLFTIRVVSSMNAFIGGTPWPPGCPPFPVETHGGGRHYTF